MLRYLVSPRLALVLLAGLGAQIASPRTMVAQDQPVVFIHGLFLGSGEWQATANLFTQQFQIQQIVPTLGWGNSFETQASNLQGALGSLMQVAALGHSNGGLAERQYVRQFGAGTRLNRGFTVGTPHRGAQLAQYVRDGTAGRYAQFLFNSIIDPFDFYYYNDPDFQDAVDFGPLFVAGGLMEAMAFIAYYFMPIVNQVAVPVSNAIPVGAEMVPASAFIAALNSSGNLSAEQANMPTRVAAATSVNPQNAFFTLFSNNPAAWGAVRRGVEYFALLLFDYYSTHPDFYLQANAWRWLQLAEVMAEFDADWHVLIGSFVGVTQSGRVVVQHQDGLVPLSSQTWPGATVQRNLLFPTVSIPHRAQVTHPSMISLMGDVLRFDFNIPLRPPPPTASISGPTYVASAGTYTWTGNPAGGTGPYTYQWSYLPQGGSWTNLGTAQTQSRSISWTTPDFSLKVVVTDPVGSGSSTIFVDNGLSDPGGCGPCSPTCRC
jgi:pimeloyl-ACP methyl ester carboxylesterase